MTTHIPLQVNQSFSGFSNLQKQGVVVPLKTPERRTTLRSSFQTASLNSAQKSSRPMNIPSSLTNNHTTPNNQQSTPNSKATPNTTITPSRHAHHSRSKSYCGVAHYGIGSTTEIIITSKSRQVIKNKMVKEEPPCYSPSMLLDDKENVVNASPSVHNLEMPTLPALAAVKKSWQLCSPQKNSTPTKKRSTSCLTPSTPLSISTSLTTIREPTLGLTPKSRARFEINTDTHKFNAYSKINNIDAISISVSEDEGTEVWCGERKGIIAIFDTNTCKPAATIYEEKEKLYVSCMCPVGEYMWAGMADGSINIYNIKKRILVKNLHGHIGTVTDIVNLGNDLIASCSVDFSIRLWDSSTCTPKVNCIGMRSLWVNTLCSASGLLWSGSDDSLIRVWDTNTGLTVKEIIHSPQMSKNKSVESLDSETSEGESARNKEINGVTQLSYCSKTNRVWSASRDCSVKIWNPTTYTCEHSINFPSYVNCMHIAGKYVWIATNKELSIWSAIDKSLVARFPVNGFVFCIKTVGDRVWIACSDKSIRVYNINDSGATEVEKRQFHGSKRLSSEFVSLDVTSPLSAPTQPDMPKFVAHVEENIINLINYDDFTQSQPVSDSNQLSNGTNVADCEDISIMMKNELVNIDSDHHVNTSPSEVDTNLLGDIIFPLEESISTTLPETVADISLLVIEKLPIDYCQQPSNLFTTATDYSTAPSIVLDSMIGVELEYGEQTKSLNIQNCTAEGHAQHHFTNPDSDSAVKIDRGTRDKVYLCALPIKECIKATQQEEEKSKDRKNEDAYVDIELKECQSPPSLSTPSSENCQSISNGRLLFSDELVEFEEPDQSSGCNVVFQILKNMFLRKNTK